MIFRQLFEPLSSTYTYLLGCEETGQVVLIDPVIVATERDLAEANRLGLTLAYTLETHIHAQNGKRDARVSSKNKYDQALAPFPSIRCKVRAEPVLIFTWPTFERD